MTRDLEKQDKKISQPAQQENFFVEVIKILATAGILAWGIRTFVAEARYIPSSSMERTLLINDRLIIEKIGYHFEQPQRGDVIVFNTEHIKELEKPEYQKEAFIKRVIGLPGDVIAIKDGVVYVNKKPISEEYIAEKPDQDFGPVKVPPDHYLVLGDNRNNSYDSRFWGFVPKENIIGRAVFRFWPVNRLGTIDPTPLYPEK
jgi:signal peptidase I